MVMLDLFLLKNLKFLIFSPKNIYLIKKIINGYDEKLFNIGCEENSFNECVKCLVKDALEYCGVVDDQNSEPNIMLNGILFNKMQIEHIDQIIKKHL